MIRPTTRATLFPYTTLFRSRVRGVDIRASGSNNPGATNAVRTMGMGYGIAVFVIDVGKGLLATLWVPGLALADAGLPAASPDRKSTRLNSSHSSISYAVFCL